MADKLSQTMQKLVVRNSRINHMKTTKFLLF